jgi:hypothetical protein
VPEMRAADAGSHAGGRVSVAIGDRHAPRSPQPGDEERELPSPTSFVLAGASHVRAPGSCAACAPDFPRPCAHPGCGGRVHGALVVLGTGRYVVTQCDRCLLPEAREMSGGG